MVEKMALLALPSRNYFWYQEQRNVTFFSYTVFTQTYVRSQQNIDSVTITSCATAANSNMNESNST